MDVWDGGKVLSVQWADDGSVKIIIEDRHELIDISPTNVIVGKAPVPPDGYEITRIDVVVRLRRKAESQAV
jgi:hypothetical protein